MKRTPWLATNVAAASFADDFRGGYNTTTWSANSWLGGWNGEFSFYTGNPSNRSRNIAVEDGILYLQPDLTANFRPDGGEQLGWGRVLGCGRTDPTTANDHHCTVPKDTPSFALDTPEDGPCTVPWDASKCNETAGVCVPHSTFGHQSCTYSMLPPVTSASIRTTRSFKFGRLEIRARLPRGDWLWPALWLLQEEPAKYGGWPRSGEIDVRGNVTESNAIRSPHAHLPSSLSRR